MILKKLKMGARMAAADFTPKKKHSMRRVKCVTKLGDGFYGN